MEFQGDRDDFDGWAERKGGPDGVRQYWIDRNSESLDASLAYQLSDTIGHISDLFRLFMPVEKASSVMHAWGPGR